MNFNAIESNHVINGRDSAVHVLLDGAEYDIFWVKSFEVTSNLDVAELGRIGAHSDAVSPGKLSTDASFSGYYGSNIFVKIHEKYKNTGKMPDVTFLVHTQDPNSQRGTQIVRINKVLITQVPVVQVDESTYALEGSYSFRCQDWDVIQHFNYLPNERV